MIDKEAREAIVAYRLEKAHKTLDEIPIETKTHAGALRMLSLHFTKTQKLSIELNRFYVDLFDNRQSGDYADFTIFDRKMVEELYKQAIIFIDTIEKLIK